MYPPTEINRHSLQAYSGVFVPKRDIYLPCTCRCAPIHARHGRWLRMFGSDQNEGFAGNEEDPGNGHKITKRLVGYGKERS